MTTAILWTDYKGMAYDLAIRLSHKFFERVDVDDLVGEASLAFVEATRSFDPDKASHFSTHFQWCMRHRFRNFLYREKKQEKVKKTIISQTTQSCMVRTRQITNSPAFSDLLNKGGDFAKLLPFLMAASEDPTIQRPFAKRKEALKKAQEANGWTAKHTKSVFKKAKVFLKENQ